MGVTKDVYEILKDITKLAREAGNQQMIELSIDVQMRLFELREENQKLKQENEQLKGTKALEEDIIRHENGYITRKSEEGQNLKYCGTCWANGKKLVGLTACDIPGMDYRRPICNACRSKYSRPK